MTGQVRTSWQSAAWRAFAIGWLAGLVVASAHGQAGQEAPKPEAQAPAQEQPEFLRVVNDRDRLISLQVGIRTYQREAGGPIIRLVPVAHVGETVLYQRLQEVLDQSDLVLYESVKPAGAGGAGGETDEQRVEGTKAAMKFIAAVIEADRQKRGEYAASLAQLRDAANQRDSRLGGFVGIAIVDGWGQPLIYQLDEQGYALTSLGADELPGGAGVAADLTVADLGPIEPLALNGDGGLQAQFAAALGLRFQLDAIDYERPNWRCSDMAMDQLDRALQKHNLSVAPLQDMLDGSSLPAYLIKAMLGMVKLLNALTEGGASDLLKVMLIELLGDERIVRQALNQFGPAFSQIIIGERNQVVVDDLKRILEQEPQVKSVAVFYGAGHMPDFDARLKEQLGYRSDGEMEWVTAIEVNLARSSVPPQQMRQLRMMLRQSLRQQLLTPRPHEN